jgi:hydrogenase maturation protease
VGCQPLDVGEGIGLSAPVARAVDGAVSLVIDQVRRLLDARPEPAATAGREA